MNKVETEIRKKKTVEECSKKSGPASRRPHLDGSHTCYDKIRREKKGYGHDPGKGKNQCNRLTSDEEVTPEEIKAVEKTCENKKQQFVHVHRKSIAARV
jgi:hypothetical protein